MSVRFPCVRAVGRTSGTTSRVHLVVDGGTRTAEAYLNGVRLNDISTTAETYGATPVGQVVAGESTAGRAYDTLVDRSSSTRGREARDGDRIRALPAASPDAI